MGFCSAELLIAGRVVRFNAAGGSEVVDRVSLRSARNLMHIVVPIYSAFFSRLMLFVCVFCTIVSTTLVSTTLVSTTLSYTALAWRKKKCMKL